MSQCLGEEQKQMNGIMAIVVESKPMQVYVVAGTRDFKGRWTDQQNDIMINVYICI
jgi:hypothetical protein